MDKEWMRRMLPEKPPKGYDDWIQRAAQGDLDMSYLLYSAERVKVYPPLKNYMEPKDFEPIKSIWQTRCTCTCCGEDFVTHHVSGGFTMYSGPDGQLYPVDPVNPDPCDCDAEDLGYDSQFVQLSDNDTIACPFCDSAVEVLHRSKLRGGRTRQTLGGCVQNIGSYTAVIFWLTANRVDSEGLSFIETYPRDAYVIGEKGGITRFRHTSGSSTCFMSEHRLSEWKLSNSMEDSSVILYHNYGSINNRMCGAHVWCSVPYLGGCSGEKTGLDEYIQRGGHYPVTYLTIWRKHRNIENLVKAGWTRLIEGNITRYQEGTSRILSKEIKGVDFKMSKPHEMLYMTKEYLRVIGQMSRPWTPDKFEAWLEYRQIGSCSASEFDLYYDQFGREGTQALFDLLRVDQKADFPKVSAYMKKQNASPRDTRMLVDAREMAEALHPERELTEEERWPRHLMAVHDRLTQQIQMGGDPKTNKELESGFLAVVEAYGCLEWNDGDLRIVLPRSNSDLVREGNILRHCVGGYGKQHCAGKLIFFVRKYRRPDRSYYTLNIDMTSGQPKQIQLHGYGNERHGVNKEHRHKIPQKVLDFVERWKKEVLMPWWLQQIHTDKKERTA